MTAIDTGRNRTLRAGGRGCAIGLGTGISEGVVRELSASKLEPQWMLEFRLRSLQAFIATSMMPTEESLPPLDFDAICRAARPIGRPAPLLGQQMSARVADVSSGASLGRGTKAAGIAAQDDSVTVYERNRKDLERAGVLFVDFETAVRDYPEIVRRYLGTVIAPSESPSVSLNSAAWSGGSFIYVPPGVRVDAPLQAYRGGTADAIGPFGRTLIVVGEGSEVHYIEGCLAPVYSSDVFRCNVVELVASPGCRITHTTIQNWSPNVVNLVTKRARAEADSRVTWIDGNNGSRLTRSTQSLDLVGPNASGEVLSIAYAGAGQTQDFTAKVRHLAPDTTSTIVSKSISNDGGSTSDRAEVHVEAGANRAQAHLCCDALILDGDSASVIEPDMHSVERDTEFGSDAMVSTVAKKQLFYLMSRGLSETGAMSCIVNGFIEPVTRALPLEYAVEWDRLMELQMGAVIG